MLKIIKENFERVNHLVDFELENNVLLYDEDWNGEIYSNGYDLKTNQETNISYKPVYKFQIDNLDLENIEENSDEWYEATKIIGFEEF